MSPVLVAVLCLLAVASPIQGLDSCSGPEECSEEGSLLQVHRSPSEQVPIESAPAPVGAGTGCPNSFTWGIIEAAARAVFSQTIQEYVPFHANHTWTDEPLSYSGCKGTVSGSAKMVADADFQLDKFKCVSATCAKSSWLGCTEYNPMHILVAGSASLLTFEASADGQASWGAGCVNGSGSATLTDGKTSFKVVSPSVKGQGTVDLLVSPPTVSSPDITELDFDYDGIEDVQCSMAGKHVELCVDAQKYVTTDEFKQTLADTIKKSLSLINQALAELLKEHGLSLEQLASGQAEFHEKIEKLVARKKAEFRGHP